ncbi:phosphoglucosamine mutase [Hydrococcus rivularis NIES-593]|uniref:Phosphoglucosamine mutase n=1 Tax=Hydrococcus rivularis NIES-593 TaxID=1921803 RepID=A0A1U7HQ06_9CYAN|nr:phosphoglucosamine mutase [Hydrococcus rivularis]OKH25672.1 phosphoglucosamine mutase [Hydrococcus rivularis NIES-593]
MASSFMTTQDPTETRLEGMSLPASPLFGTDGIRGKAGALLTAPLALQIGFWAGQVLKTYHSQPGAIVVGQDSRNSSDMLAMALSAGLTSAGMEVWHVGLCPTPAVAYLTSISPAIAGVAISASHNPPEDNGIKFFGVDGTKLSDELQNQIEAGLRGKLSESVSESWGRQYYRPELLDKYFQSLQASFPCCESLAGMRIVLDLAWGAAVHLAPKLFEAMGAEVICLHDRPDGNRINVNCGATHLDFLQAAVGRTQADLGLAFDGDADRLMAVDERGRVVNGDYILYLWGRELMQAGRLPGKTTIATVMSNLGFERAWQRLGGQLIRTAVGDRYVWEEMLRQGAMLGGEQSGHILCRHYGVSGDGLLSALHLAALVRQSGTLLGELRDRSFAPYPQLLKNVRVSDRDRRLDWRACEPLQQTIQQAETAMGEEGRILIRASGTEPVIRVMVEATELELASYWSDRLVSAVEQHLAA